MGSILRKYKMAKQSVKEEQDFSLLLSSDLSGLKNNEVVDYCLELLLFSFRLSSINSLDTSSIDFFKEKMINDILTWSSKLSALKKYDEKDIVRVRYCLCVFIDELLMKNELFINSSWANNSLTVRLFDETLGGNNFYNIAHSWLNNPAKNKDFLEFVYVCIILGYKGKYSNNKDMEDRILLFCNNITSSLAPLYSTQEEIALTKAYGKVTKNSFWHNFQKIYLKKIIIIFPLCIVTGIFAYVIFDLEINNIRIQENVNEIMSRVIK